MEQALASSRQLWQGDFSQIGFGRSLLKPRSRVGRIALVGLSVCPSICGSAGCKEECDDVGATWCRGTQLKACERMGGGGHRSAFNTITTNDCAERGFVCSEETDKARCVFKDRRCAGRADAVFLCVGDFRATCEGGASQPVPDVNCAGHSIDKYCVESDKDARCSGFPELCSEPVPDRCLFDLVWSCQNQFWLPLGSCFGDCGMEGATECVETTNYKGAVLETVAVCTGQPGIWLPVEPACESGCACESEGVCRCL